MPLCRIFQWLNPFDFLFRRFSKTHEWVDVDSDTKKGKMGITNYAANALGDVVHVDLPEAGDSFAKGESIVSNNKIRFKRAY